jgi:secernin
MCDTLCVRTRDAMLFAKNSDRHPGEDQVVEWHARRAAGAQLRTQYLSIPDPGGFAFVGSRPTWLWGVEHGVNEHGVAIGNEKIWTIDRPHDSAPAFVGMDLVRLGLERARSAADALDVLTALLEQHGQGGSGEPHRDEPYYSSFLIADPRDGFVVETSNRTWVARHVGAGAAVSNRISLTTDWTESSPDVAAGTNFDDYRRPRMPTSIADHRLAVTTSAVERGTAATPADLAETMRSHGPRRGAADMPVAADAEGLGFSVCMHRPELHSQTTASMIAELRTDAPPRVWTSLGNPCTSVYVPGFPAAVAPELADAAQWRRFARLRDRAEAVPEARAEIRAVLAPVEAELWAEADAVVAAGEQSKLEAFARTAYAPVAAALHRLGV